jgi:hypothetical protein
VHGKFDDLGQFADPSLLILTSLADGPKHGYAIMTDVAGFSGVRMEPGTLYGALSRLERRGWVRPLAARSSHAANGPSPQRRASRPVTVLKASTTRPYRCEPRRLEATWGPRSGWDNASSDGTWPGRRASLCTNPPISSWVMIDW